MDLPPLPPSLSSPLTREVNGMRQVQSHIVTWYNPARWRVHEYLQRSTHTYYICTYITIVKYPSMPFIRRYCHMTITWPLGKYQFFKILLISNRFSLVSFYTILPKMWLLPYTSKRELNMATDTGWPEDNSFSLTIVRIPVDCSSCFWCLQRYVHSISITLGSEIRCSKICQSSC